MKITFENVYEAKEFARELLAGEHLEDNKHLRDELREKENRNSSLLNENSNLNSCIASLNTRCANLESENRRLLDELTRYRATVNLDLVTGEASQFTKIMMAGGVAINVQSRADVVAACKDHAGIVRDALSTMFPAQKIPQIKFIRNATGAGLREAKAFVEGEPLVIF